jgi:hypothetical protein
MIHALTCDVSLKAICLLSQFSFQSHYVLQSKVVAWAGSA